MYTGVAGVSGSTLSTLDYIDGLYRSIGGTATTTANGSPQSTNLDIRISSDKDQDQDINDDPRKDIFSFVCQKWPEKDFETILCVILSIITSSILTDNLSLSLCPLSVL